MKQYLTQQEIEDATVEELENNVKALQEELDQLKGIETEEGKERFRELVHLRILSNIRINLLEFREMVWKGRERNNKEE